MSVGAVGDAMPLPPGSEKRTDAERAGLAFERMLLVQLTQQLAKSAEPEGESSTASKAYRDLLPGALADSMIAGGGIGLGAALAAQIDSAAGGAAA